MKQYNTENFGRFKEDIKGRELYYLVEKIARKFNTSDSAIGALTLEDLIQEGLLGFVKAIDKVDMELIDKSEDPDKTLNSFLAKRIKGAIRRAININRSGIRLPEYLLNDMRNNPEGNERLLQEYFSNGSIVSLDGQSSSQYPNEQEHEAASLASRIPYEDDDFKKERLTTELLKIMDSVLTKREKKVIQLSFGIDCEKLSAKEIAIAIGLKGESSFVTVSEIKRAALLKLKNDVFFSQVEDLI
jgi:RNA polymerase sigma factor (sigma-70 family)